MDICSWEWRGYYETVYNEIGQKASKARSSIKNGLTALLGTGAYIPVWTDDEDILISFLGAEFVRSNVQMSGFGGVTYGNLYKENIDVGGILYPRACLKNHSRDLHSPLCG